MGNAEIYSKDLAPDQSVPTANGAPLRVNVYQKYNTVVTVNGVKVVKADVPTSAGVVHVVEKVIPTVAKGDNIAAVLTADGRFGTLLAAVGAAGFAEAICWNSYKTLQGGEQLTPELYSLRSGR